MSPKAKKTITELITEDKDLVYEMVKNTVQEVLEA